MKCKNCGGDNESHNNKCRYCGSFDFKVGHDLRNNKYDHIQKITGSFKTVDEVKKEHGSYESLDGTDFSNGGIIAQLGSGEKLVPFNSSVSTEIINENMLPHWEHGEKIKRSLPKRPKMKLKNRGLKFRNIFKPSIKAFEEFEKALKQIEDWSD